MNPDKYSLSSLMQEVAAMYGVPYTAAVDGGGQGSGVASADIARLYQQQRNDELQRRQAEQAMRADMARALGLAFSQPTAAEQRAREREAQLDRFYRTQLGPTYQQHANELQEAAERLRREQESLAQRVLRTPPPEENQAAIVRRIAELMNEDIGPAQANPGLRPRTPAEQQEQQGWRRQGSPAATVPQPKPAPAPVAVEVASHLPPPGTPRRRIIKR